MTDQHTSTQSASAAFPAAERSNWPALLALHSTETLTSAMTALKEAGYRFHHVSKAAEGFALLQLEDSCQLQPFYLGELPLAIARVEVGTPDGRLLEGACQLMSADHQKVEAIAVWDAILAGQSEDGQKSAAVAEGLALLEQAVALRDAITMERKAILAATKVNFQMMDE